MRNERIKRFKAWCGKCDAWKTEHFKKGKCPICGSKLSSQSKIMPRKIKLEVDDE